MNAIELTVKLTGREYGDEITKEEEAAAKAAGLVVVFGYSDDNVELRGAIHDEVGACEGATLYLTTSGLLKNECDDDDCPHFAREKAKAQTITAHWSGDEQEFAWTFKTDIPHTTFEIMDGEDKFCRGIVFALKDVPYPASK